MWIEISHHYLIYEKCVGSLTPHRILNTITWTEKVTKHLSLFVFQNEKNWVFSSVTLSLNSR